MILLWKMLLAFYTLLSFQSSLSEDSKWGSWSPKVVGLPQMNRDQKHLLGQPYIASLRKRTFCCNTEVVFRSLPIVYLQNCLHSCSDSVYTGLLKWVFLTSDPRSSYKTLDIQIVTERIRGGVWMDFYTQKKQLGLTLSPLLSSISLGLGAGFWATVYATWSCETCFLVARGKWDMTWPTCLLRSTNQKLLLWFTVGALLSKER